MTNSGEGGKKLKWWQWLGISFLALTLLGAIFGDSDPDKSTGKVVTVTQTQPESQSEVVAETAPEPEPVDLTIRAVGEGGVVHRKSVVIRGRVTPGSIVMVDGRRAKVAGGQWRRSVKLDRGTNWVDVVGLQDGMTKTEERVEVTRKMSAAERAARAAARERKRQRAAAKEAARVAALTKSFSGSGSKNIGTINVTEDSRLVWTNNEDPMFRQMLIYDKGFGISVSSDAASGDTVVPEGRYKNITVAGGSSWTITIKPQG